MLKTDFENELARAGVDYDVIEHEPTSTAREEAAAVGVPPTAVAKTLVLATGTGFVRAVLRAADRLDLHRVRAALGGDASVRLATEEELVVAYPAFELGAVPPWGGPAGDRVLVDRRVAERDSVVLEAGRHVQSIRLKVSDLLALTAAEIVELTEEHAEGGRRLPA